MTTCAQCQSEFTKPRDLTGARFGKWVVLGAAEKKHGQKMWSCRCDCGSLKDVYHGHLVGGKTKGCRCVVTKHGMSATPEYTSWVTMKRRCMDERFHAYPRYGGRGIKVHDEWANHFDAFYRDLGPRPEGTTLDRIDNLGDYEPGNCRWATPKEQANNRRSTRFVLVGGKAKTISDLAMSAGIKHASMYSRLKRQGAI